MIHEARVWPDYIDGEHVDARLSVYTEEHSGPHRATMYTQNASTISGNMEYRAEGYSAQVRDANGPVELFVWRGGAMVMIDMTDPDNIIVTKPRGQRVTVRTQK